MAREPPATAAPPAETPPPAAPPGPRTLQFIRGFNKYQRGDVAGFPAAFAQQLIAKGVAVEFRPRAADSMVRK